MYGASFFVLVALLSFFLIFSCHFLPSLPSANPRWPLRRSSPLSSIFAVVLVDVVPIVVYAVADPFAVVVVIVVIVVVSDTFFAVFVVVVVVDVSS